MRGEDHHICAFVCAPVLVVIDPTIVSGVGRDMATSTGERLACLA